MNKAMQLDLDFKSDRLSSMAAAVRFVVPNYPVDHKFFGNELHDDVAELYPKARKMYTDTLLRTMRRFCSHLYITVDHNRSLYKRVAFNPGGKA